MGYLHVHVSCHVSFYYLFLVTDESGGPVEDTHVVDFVDQFTVPTTEQKYDNNNNYEFHVIPCRTKFIRYIKNKPLSH